MINKIENNFLMLIFVSLIVVLIGCTTSVNSELTEKKIEERDQHPILKNINLPNAFQIDIFADDLGESFNLPGPNKGVRFMEFYNGVLFASIPNAGVIVALPDKNKDGKADEVIRVIEGLNKPHGIAFLNDYIYIANEDSVIKARINEDFIVDKATIEYLVDLPKGGHWTRTIRLHNGSLYISVGSSCNNCIEDDIRRGSILKCTLDGKCQPYARGIRNAVGFTFHPLTNEIYATENSRDFLGDDLPPDEINIIKADKHYGWPFCYGKNIIDPDFKGSNCNNKEPSFIDLQAHSAPLGLTFNFGNNFPVEFKGDLFVAYHGSWNRKVPTGYKIVRIDMGTKQVQDFATGWLTKDYKVLGRPVDVIFDKEGIMYVSDDNAGIIYRIWYEK